MKSATRGSSPSSAGKGSAQPTLLAARPSQSSSGLAPRHCCHSSVYNQHDMFCPLRAARAASAPWPSAYLPQPRRTAASAAHSPRAVAARRKREDAACSAITDDPVRRANIAVRCAARAGSRRLLLSRRGSGRRCLDPASNFVQRSQLGAKVFVT